METGVPSPSRLAKSSRSMTWATVVVASSRNSSAIDSSSQSLLKRTSRRSGSSTFMACAWKVAALAVISSSLNIGRVDERPLGSPTRAVPLPMISTTVWPAS